MRKLTVFAAALAIVGVGGMARAAESLVDVAWVKANIGKPAVAFLDVRGRLGGKSKADYLSAHIPGAIYSNYLKDGWRAKDKNGTVGMLPPVGKLEELIGGLGIDNNTHVIVVSNGGMARDVGSATRIYWTFKVLGHDRISVLNGGMTAYTKAQGKDKQPLNPLEKGDIKPRSKVFKASLRQDMLISKAEVKKALKTRTVLVDNRPNNQYMGIMKHGMAKKPGTIPGARNLPENWLTVNGGGVFRDKSALGKLYAAAGVPTEGDQVNFCNTGHWASLGWFVSSQILGNRKARLYDGSMVEWSGDSAAPLERKIKLN